MKLETGRRLVDAALAKGDAVSPRLLEGLSTAIVPQLDNCEHAAREAVVAPLGHPAWYTPGAVSTFRAAIEGIARTLAQLEAVIGVADRPDVRARMDKVKQPLKN